MQMREQMEVLIEKMLDGQILLSEAVAEFEKTYILNALKRNGEHLSQTAECLGIHRNTLSKKVAVYQQNCSETPKKLLVRRSR
jgi:DNA-binding NtrC family response regulator